MTMVAGRLDQRVTLWERQDNGGDGFARPVYVKTGTWWGRVDAVSDRQRVPQSPQCTVDYATDARMTVADYARIEPLLNEMILDLAADLYQRRTPGAASEKAGDTTISWDTSRETVARVMKSLRLLRLGVAQ